jgi:transposase
VSQSEGTMEPEVLTLTPEECRELEAAFSRSSSGLVRRRLHGILLLGSGHSMRMAAAAAGLAVGTLQLWARRYLDQRSSRALVRSHSSRTRRDIPDLLGRVRLMLSSAPNVHGYESKDWTPHLVKLHLSSAHGIRLPLSLVDRLLGQVRQDTRKRP